MISIGDVLLKLGVDTGDLDKGLQDIGNKIQGHQKAIGLAMTGVGAAIIGSFAMMAKAAADEEVNIQRLSIALKNVGVNYDDVKDSLEATITATQRKTGIADTEQRDALNELILVTGDYDKALKLLPLALDLAAAKGMDLGSATQVVARAAEGNTLALTRMFPQLKNIAQAQENLTNAQKGAEKAQKDLTSAEEKSLDIKERLLGLSRSLRDAQQSLIHAQESQADALRELNKVQSDSTSTSEDLDRAQRRLRDAGWSLTRVQERLQDVIKDNNETLSEQEQANKAVTEAQTKLINESNKLTDAQRKVAESGDILSRVQEMVKGAAEAAVNPFEVLSKFLMNLAQKIGSFLLPILKRLVDIIVPIITKVQEWTTAHPELTGQLMILVGVVGAVAAVLGPLLIMLPMLIAGFTLLLGPVGIAAAALMGLIAVGTLVWMNWDTIREKAQTIFRAIANFFVNIWARITNIFREHWNKILAILFPPIGLPILIARNWEAIVDTVKNIFNRVGDAIKQPIEWAVKWAIEAINSLINLINRIPLVNIPTIPTPTPTPTPTPIPGTPTPTPTGGEGINLGAGAYGYAGEGMYGYAGQTPGSEYGWIQKGGIAMRPMLAHIGEQAPRIPEAIIPLDKLGGMLGSREINIYVELDGRTIARAIGQPLVDEIRLKTGVRI